MCRPARGAGIRPVLADGQAEDAAPRWPGSPGRAGPGRPVRAGRRRGRSGRRAGTRGGGVSCGTVYGERSRMSGPMASSSGCLRTAARPYTVPNSPGSVPMPYILALDSGTTSRPRDPVRPRRRHPGRGPEGVRPASSRRPAGSSTTRTRSGPPRSAWPSRPCGRAGIGAEDVAAVGITNQRETTVVWDRADGRAGLQRHRLAGPPHGRVLRPAAGRRARARSSATRPAWSSTPTSPAARSRWLLDNVPGARAARPKRGELAFGTDRHLAGLEADRRRAPRHRFEQRLADDALQHPHAGSGTTSC